MPLQEPVAVYNASNNIEAQVICNILNDAGVEAYVTQDVSQVGTWLFGLLPEIHKPQVWIDRSEVDRAKPILEEYERQLIERRKADQQEIADKNASVQADCEECGRSSAFPSSQRGTVQDCPYCGAYVDVGDSPDAEEWWNVEHPTDDDPPEP
jgi:hypothetical protein